MIALWSLLASGATIPLTRPEMCALASFVAVAEPTSSEVRWAADRSGGIETVVWLAIGPVVKGKPRDTLTLVLKGGEIDGLKQTVEDVPVLGVDRSYLLYLAPSDSGFVVVGGEQGAVLLPEGVGERGIRALSGC